MIDIPTLLITGIVMMAVVMTIVYQRWDALALACGRTIDTKDLELLATLLPMGMVIASPIFISWTAKVIFLMIAAWIQTIGIMAFLLANSLSFKRPKLKHLYDIEHEMEKVAYWKIGPFRTRIPCKSDEISLPIRHDNQMLWLLFKIILNIIVMALYGLILISSVLIHIVLCGGWADGIYFGTLRRHMRRLRSERAASLRMEQLMDLSM